MERQKWYAVYTKPRWEKKVTRLLQEKELECYCPLNKVKRRWSDRIKTIEEPLFKSYVFVRIREKKMTEVRMTSGVVNFVYWAGKPAIIRDKEIETIRKFLNEYTEVEAQPVDVEVDAEVIIKRGLLMDRKGVVQKVMNKRVQVIIESIGYRLIAYVDRSNISVVKNDSNTHPTKKNI